MKTIRITAAFAIFVYFLTSQTTKDSNVWDRLPFQACILGGILGMLLSLPDKVIKSRALLFSALISLVICFTHYLIYNFNLGLALTFFFVALLFGVIYRTHVTRSPKFIWDWRIGSGKKKRLS